MIRRGLCLLVASISAVVLAPSCAPTGGTRPQPQPQPEPTPPLGGDPDPGPSEPMARVEISAAALSPAARGPGPSRLRELAARAAAAGGRLDLLSADEARALMRWISPSDAARPLTFPTLILSPRIEATVTSRRGGPLTLTLRASPRSDGGTRLEARGGDARATADLSACEALVLTVPTEGGEAIVVLTLVGGE